MIKGLYRVLMAFNSTSWMLIIYAIKEHLQLFVWNDYLSSLCLIIAEIILSVVVLNIARCLEKDELTLCTELEQADNEFLPVYLGYAFAALSISDAQTLIFVYLIVFIFSFLMSAYFNPTYILFGYHYYHATTKLGTHVFLISRTTERNPLNGKFTELRRINNTTYISHRRNG